MFIVSSKGNFIPVQNVKLVSPTATGGSKIRLKTGESFSLDKPPADVFKNMVSSDQNVAILIGSLYSQLEVLTKSTTKQIKDLQDSVSSKMQSLEGKVLGTTERVIEVTGTLRDVSTALVNSTDRSMSASRTLLDSTKVVANTVKELNNAIEEAISG